MSIESQAETIAFLSDPASHGMAGEEVAVIETHISVIILVGPRAFKLKQALKLPYVDFSTIEKRRAACRKELVLNRRTAPTLYRTVRRITRTGDGGLCFDGEGELVDTVVEMERFDEETLFDRMAVRGALDTGLITDLATAIARFHDVAAIDGDRSGGDNMSAVLDINEGGLAASDLFASDDVAAFNSAFREALETHRPLLDARQAAGKVRRCHGDLHLRNICLFEGAPILFDCIEFDDALATIDVLYDLAFLLMDLWHRNLRGLANWVFNRYFEMRDESDGLPLLPFFMAVRAAVRAHVTATSAQSHEGEEAEMLSREARAYFDLALDLLKPVPARLVAIGGLSGSGKSSIAARIAERIGPPPGARVLSSDRTRKRLFGVAPETRLPPSAYRPSVSAEVYERIFVGAGQALVRDHGVIADAVFDRPRDRERIELTGQQADVPFAGIWLEADPEVLFSRVDSRAGGPSDATRDVVRQQLDHDRGVMTWTEVDATGDQAATVSDVLKAIGLDPTPPPAQPGGPDLKRIIRRGGSSPRKRP